MFRLPSSMLMLSYTCCGLSYTKELYLRWRDVSEQLTIVKRELVTESRGAKALQRENVFLERKLSTQQATEKKLLESAHTVNELKLEKKLIADQLKRALSDIKQVELSKRDLRESLSCQHKLEVETLKLTYSSEANQITLEKQKSDLIVQSREDKIKRLESELSTLTNKARQYDNIASSGIKSLISLNAFNERGIAR